MSLTNRDVINFRNVASSIVNNEIEGVSEKFKYHLSKVIKKTDPIFKKYSTAVSDAECDFGAEDPTTKTLIRNEKEGVKMSKQDSKLYSARLAELIEEEVEFEMVPLQNVPFDTLKIGVLQHLDGFVCDLEKYYKDGDVTSLKSVTAKKSQ